MERQILPSRKSGRMHGFPRGFCQKELQRYSKGTWVLEGYPRGLASQMISKLAKRYSKGTGVLKGFPQGLALPGQGGGLGFSLCSPKGVVRGRRVTRVERQILSRAVSGLTHGFPRGFCPKVFQMEQKGAQVWGHFGELIVEENCLKPGPFGRALCKLILATLVKFGDHFGELN